MAVQSKFVLGIETSCDDTSVCIIRRDEKEQNHILSFLSYSQIADLDQWGGVVPEIAARNHLVKITPLLKESFKQAQITPKDLTAIGVTTWPGLIGALLTGINAAKTLSLLHHTPIIPVNHLYAHLEAIHIDQQINYPYLGILLSGGHSIYCWVEDAKTFHILGSTIDDAAGEAFDKGGKLMGLGYPAGHLIDGLSQFATEVDEERFPIGLKGSKDARLSFSGLKTAMRLELEKNPTLLELCTRDISQSDPARAPFYNLCASYQRAIVKAILLKYKYARQIVKEKFMQQNYDTVVGGGVACNKGLRAELSKKYQRVHFVSPKYCTDNGAMIAAYAASNLDQAISFPECLNLDAHSRFIDKKEYNL